MARQPAIYLLIPRVSVCWAAWTGCVVFAYVYVCALVCVYLYVCTHMCTCMQLCLKKWPLPTKDQVAVRPIKLGVPMEAFGSLQHGRMVVPDKTDLDFHEISILVERATDMEFCFVLFFPQCDL